jgi:DNA methylase
LRLYRRASLPPGVSTAGRLYRRGSLRDHMRTFIRLKNQTFTRLPDEFRDEDVRYAPELVAHFVRRFTRAGDRVLDPFAGFGTTLLVAEQLGRLPLGVELEERRVDYIRSQLRDPGAIIQGDSRRIGELDIPPFALSITSPPFTEIGDSHDALTNYHAPSPGYQAYLETLQQIYAQLRARALPDARIVLEVSNLKGPSGVTPLAWDVARALSSILTFEGEVVVGWDIYSYGYDHSYCLIFRP